MGLKGISGNLSKLVGSVLQSSLERERRLVQRCRKLGEEIEATPDNITLYVLHGELSLERGKYERAKTDFETAIELAARADDTKGWLVLEQIMRDRALHGLRRMERHIVSPL